MPLVEITMGAGRSPELVHGVLVAVHEAVVSSLGVPPANVRVVVREVPLTHWMAGGVTLAERDAAGSGAAPPGAAQPGAEPPGAGQPAAPMTAAPEGTQ